VPNLNFISIINSSRGVYGDLNRKFAAISDNDPQYAAIKKIKAIILDEQVDMVLNLHDGSGFYRHRYIDSLHNPKRWGQSVIIDQKTIDCPRFGNLDAIARHVVQHVNDHLFDDEHVFQVKNTRTREGDVEMAKTLTYFAARHLKPAFGLEASKSFPIHKRAYYHIHAMESFMDVLGIAYERRFFLTDNGVKDAIYKNVNLAFYDRKIFLDVHNARDHLNYVPLKKDADIEFIPSNPLIAIVDIGKNFRIFHGNRKITHIMPQYFPYDSSIDAITMFVDGEEKIIRFGEMINVGRSFAVAPKDGYRVNVIGYKKKGVSNESGITVEKDDILERFSIDKTGGIFRVEVYRNEKFSGMVLVDFNRSQDSPPSAKARSDPAFRLAKLKNEAVARSDNVSKTSPHGR
jgi:hypothetical protein